MKALNYGVALKLALALVILDQATGARAPFALNAEQKEVLRALLEHERVVVLKGRQVGISTVCCLYDLLFAIVNPGTAVAIIADVHDKAVGLLAKCSAWARHLKIPLTVDNERRLVLANGSEIRAYTANTPDAGSDEVKVGRSFSAALIHFSELAFYARDRAVFAAVTSTALKNARIVVESTATPAENLFRSIWDKGPGWHHIFLSVEHHDAYQEPPESITDEEWARLQEEYGFTSRPHAAWWWKKLATDFDGDLHRCLREYPVQPHHAFAFAEGRWIHDFTVAEPRSDGHWSIYVEKPDEPVIFGVDTATGQGLDASAIAAVGQRTGQLVATYKHNGIDIPSFVRVVASAAARFDPVAEVIESNGCGAAVYQERRATGRAGIVEQESSEKTGEKWMRMTATKAAIERGQVKAGPELQHEIKHSIIKLAKRAGMPKPRFEGPDDLLNAVSFALKWREANPWEAPEEEEPDPREVVSVRALLGRRRSGSW